MSSFDLINPALIDVPSPEIALSPGGQSGYSAARKSRDTIDALMDAAMQGGATATDFPNELWIEEKDRADWASMNDKYHTWPVNRIDRFTNQNPTHECTCHALVRVAEGCRNRQLGIIYPDGPKVDYRYETSKKGSVWLSPLSIYAEANPGQWGGADCTQVLNISCRRGFLPDKIQPAEYKFKHDLIGTSGGGNSNQSHGNWVRLSDFPAGWEETAKLFKPLEWIFTRDWEQVVCLVLRGHLIDVGRSGHSIPYAHWNVASKVMTYVDSYNVLRQDSLGTVRGCADGAFTIRSMTAPDNWLDPAGTLSI